MHVDALHAVARLDSAAEVRAQSTRTRILLFNCHSNMTVSLFVGNTYKVQRKCEIEN